MTLLPAPPNKLRSYQRLVRRIAGTRLGASLFSLVAHRVDNPILRLTNGKQSATSFLSGLPVFNLTTIGAKSRKKRTLSLTGLSDGEKVVLIGSNFGGTQHPSWFHNLRANPEATVTVGDRAQTFISHQAKGEEREKYWRMAVEFFHGYADYANMTAGRIIPIMVLTPKD